MAVLAKGANVAVDAAAVRATLSWRTGPAVPDVDGSALVLGADGRVRSDDDFVFYNQPRHPGGAVRHAGKSGTADAVEVDLAGIGSDVERVLFTASADNAPFGRVPGLRLVLADAASGAAIAEFDVTAGPETAMVVGELYRRDGRWKFRAVGQGYASGLAGLASDFGITVDAAPPARPSAPGFVPPPPPPGFVPPPFPGPLPPGAVGR